MKRNLLKRLSSAALALSLLAGLSITALAADKSVGNGAVKISGVLSERMVQFVIPAYEDSGTPEKTLTVPLYQLDKSSKVVYDASITPDDIFWLDYSCKVEGDRFGYGEFISGTSESSFDAIRENSPDVKSEDYPIRYVVEGEISKVSPTMGEYTIDKLCTYSFYADGYYLLQYDPAPIEFVDGSGGGIDPSEKAEYIILQVGGASVPEAPTTPTAPTLTATYNQSPVLIDGVKTPFQAYTIQENNYFKLRDIASVLSGSVKQFEVTWDGAANAIQITTGKAYTPVGGEMAAAEGQGNKVPTLNKATVYLDGKAVELTAYTIDSNNYFKLRDLGAALGFDVSWDSASGTIVVDTSSAYTPD